MAVLLPIMASPFSLQTVLLTTMTAIEKASQNDWSHFWLECDSNLVIQAFSSPQLVPWQLRTRWRNCIYLTSLMSFKISHIYREGNSCADKLANFGISLQCNTWWDLIPPFISVNFFAIGGGSPIITFDNIFHGFWFMSPHALVSLLPLFCFSRCAMRGLCSFMCVPFFLPGLFSYYLGF